MRFFTQFFRFGVTQLVNEKLSRKSQIKIVICGIKNANLATLVFPRLQSSLVPDSHNRRHFVDESC